MHPIQSLFDFRTQFFSNPSPWVGGVFGGLITGGLFGWISYVRSMRPAIFFIRDADDGSPRWKMRNLGNGPAVNIRVRDYKGQTVQARIHCYPLIAGEKRSIAWVSGGDKLEAEYTDVYGRRWYRSVGENNSTNYSRRRFAFWRRPAKDYLLGYEPEIHALRRVNQQRS